nr:Crp/Fnr family transcriptional regulator [uncultured Pedobacter sp.]
MINEELYLSTFKTTIGNYHRISEESFSLLVSLIRIQTINKNEFLLKEGQISRSLYFVCKGAIIAYFSDVQGNTYNKNIFLERQFAGSTVSALLKIPSQFTLQAIEDSTLIAINHEKYKELIEQQDDLKNFYIAYLEKNWVIDKEQREVSIVMETASVRYLKMLAKHPGIDKRIPLQHIASHLGITPTQLSRIRKEIKNK